MLRTHFTSLIALLGLTYPPVSSGTQGGPYVGYLLTTFPVFHEAVYFLLSEDNDAHAWHRLSRDGTNLTSAILESNVGTKGVRDCFIATAKDGTRFWLICTDLSMNTIHEDFNTATRFGSRSIVIFETTDLVTWSVPRLSPPLVNEYAGNVWGPEAYYDPLRDCYVVVFASRFWPANTDPGRTGPVPPNYLMFVTTQDFQNFTPAVLFFAPGFPVIDATFLHYPSEGPHVWYRWVKNEDTDTIFQQKSVDGLLGTWGDVGASDGRKGILYAKQYVNNEAPLIFIDNKDPGLFHLWIDEDTLQSYIPSTARTLHDMAAWQAEPLDTFPKNIKHGHVLPLTQKQYDAIAAKYPKIPGWST